MKKQLREEVYNKYGGLCAYTGKPLGDDWQIDHIHPKCSIIW
jgi:5-methylcytosine-specific restriction endonuclease McrA